ncbi:MAG: PrsW family intramembrane metalloprotease [Balneolaceae bacterium]|nr:PrsW family intramembrane metalloprotease [Balneolaceae bacterium]
MQTAAEIAIAFLPILFFLLFMKVMDSYQLVKIKQVATAIMIGFSAAFAAIFVNSGLISHLEIDIVSFSRYVAPVSEEILKILFILYLIRARKVGFMVDAAILGFAVGAGFAIIENIYYMNMLTDAGLLTWFVRGFGTAIMHGGTVAIAAVISKDLSDRKEWPDLLIFMPGLFAAIVLHAAFNMFILPPLTSALLILLFLPPIFIMIFKQSEQNTRNWLGTGLDSDMEILRLLMAGNISETRLGQYLSSIQNKFTPAIVGDIICYLRIYLELSIKAKGILIMKESGFDLPPDPEIEAQFSELNYLEKQIGKTGKLAMQPLLKLNNTDLWQLSMMQKNQSSGKDQSI